MTFTDELIALVAAELSAHRESIDAMANMNLTGVLIGVKFRRGRSPDVTCALQTTTRGLVKTTRRPPKF